MAVSYKKLPHLLIDRDISNAPPHGSRATAMCRLSLWRKLAGRSFARSMTSSSSSLTIILENDSKARFIGIRK